MLVFPDPVGPVTSRMPCCRFRNFSKIARDSKDELKIERNRANARKAYDALLHFIPAAALSLEEAKEVALGMAELKAALRRLGEDV